MCSFICPANIYYNIFVLCARTEITIVLLCVCFCSAAFYFNFMLERFWSIATSSLAPLVVIP
jgi:hypothetical protein